MAFNFTYDPSQYQQKDYGVLPEGDYRVRISDVRERVFSTGSQGFEITLDVAGKNSHLWYYLVINPADPKATNQRLGAFFDCFGITLTNLSMYANWRGCVGGVRVKHEMYNGEKSAKIQYLISKDKQESLPPWPGVQGAPKMQNHSAQDNLPFL